MTLTHILQIAAIFLMVALGGLFALAIIIGIVNEVSKRSKTKTAKAEKLAEEAEAERIRAEEALALSQQKLIDAAVFEALQFLGADGNSLVYESRWGHVIRRVVDHTTRSYILPVGVVLHDRQLRDIARLPGVRSAYHHDKHPRALVVKIFADSSCPNMTAETGEDIVDLVISFFAGRADVLDLELLHRERGALQAR